MTQHHDDIEVQQIIKGGLSTPEKRKAFARLRNEGLYQINKQKCNEETPTFEKIKVDSGNAQSETVHCNVCHGSYSKGFFYRHKKQCQESSQNSKPVTAVPASLLPTTEEADFVEILKSFQQNEVGNICRTDSTIRLIGRHLWLKDRTKVDKSDEVRKSVMADMRNLGNLYNQFKQLSSGDMSDSIHMFYRENWPTLRDSVVEMTSKDGSEVKYGLKNTMYYLLMKSALIIQGEALTVRSPEGKSRVDEMEHFMKLLRLHQNAVFGDAKYLINKSRQERLRLPQRCPPEELLQELRTYTLQRINHLTDQPQSAIGNTEFVELRNLVCARLTLFNARRGGEPSRLRVDQWDKRHQWLPRSAMNDLDEAEMSLFKRMDIVYGTGKGNHLVSCMVPQDCIKAIEILATPDVRIQAGILKSNSFLFPNTEKSKHHTIGWDALDAICKKASIEGDMINATNQRSRMSTIYASLDVSPADRQYFYSHLGHSAEVNAGTYQRPLPVMAVTKVGKYLDEFDQRIAKTTGNILLVQTKNLPFLITS